MYSKEYLKQQVKSAFTSDEVEGGLTDLIADVLAEYAYLHQIIDINILMENSFQRSTKLNSKIQQAADRFYSVYRGHNRIVKISNLSCYKQGNPPVVYPFELITQNAGGKYKLYAASAWNFEPNTQLTVTGYLATDCQTVELQGTNKLYMDIELDSNGVKTPCTNISEDLIVYQTWEDSNLATNPDFEENGLYYKQITLVNSLSELFSTYKDDDACFCAMTMPNYGVRLYSKTIIDGSNNYVVKYLTCPDPTVEEKDPASSIKNINNCKITNDTTFELLRTTRDREENLDKIYLYASNNLRQAGVLKSLNSLEEIIPECFPQFQSYKMLVGPVGNTISGNNTMSNDNVILHDVVDVSNSYGIDSASLSALNSSIIEYVPNGTIYIWYVLKNDLDLPMDGDNYEASQSVNIDAGIALWNEKKKAYYIPDDTQIFFKNINFKAEESETPPLHVKPLEGYKIRIYYSQNVDYQRIRDIIESFQYQIGEDFNPYKIISALVTDSTLYQKIKYVEILHSDSSSNLIPAEVIKVAQDQRWWFKDSYTDLVEFKQV